jgi:hypothetical protein
VFEAKCQQQRNVSYTGQNSYVADRVSWRSIQPLGSDATQECAKQGVLECRDTPAWQLLGKAEPAVFHQSNGQEKRLRI